MNKVTIVTDGVCDLSQAVIDKYDVIVAPFRLFLVKRCIERGIMREAR